MRVQYIFSAAIALLVATLAWPQISPRTTAPSIRPGTVIQYPGTTYRVEWITLESVQEKPLLYGDRGLSGDAIIGRHLASRGTKKAEIQRTIDRYGREGWILDRTQVLEAGMIEDVMLVFRRPGPTEPR